MKTHLQRNAISLTISLDNEPPTKQAILGVKRFYSAFEFRSKARNRNSLLLGVLGGLMVMALVSVSNALSMPAIAQGLIWGILGATALFFALRSIMESADLLQWRLSIRVQHVGTILEVDLARKGEIAKLSKWMRSSQNPQHIHRWCEDHEGIKRYIDKVCGQQEPRDLTLVEEAFLRKVYEADMASGKHAPAEFSRAA